MVAPGPHPSHARGPGRLVLASQPERRAGQLRHPFPLAARPTSPGHHQLPDRNRRCRPCAPGAGQAAGRNDVQHRLDRSRHPAQGQRQPVLRRGGRLAGRAGRQLRRRHGGRSSRPPLRGDEPLGLVRPPGRRSSRPRPGQPAAGDRHVGPPRLRAHAGVRGGQHHRRRRSRRRRQAGPLGGGPRPPGRHCRHASRQPVGPSQRRGSDAGRADTAPPAPPGHRSSPAADRRRPHRRRQMGHRVREECHQGRHAQCGCPAGAAGKPQLRRHGRSRQLHAVQLLRRLGPRRRRRGAGHVRPDRPATPSRPAPGPHRNPGLCARAQRSLSRPTASTPASPRRCPRPVS